MRKLFMMAVVVAMVAACGKGKSVATGEPDKDMIVSQDPDVPVQNDSTLYGLCASGTQGDLLRFNTDQGASIRLDVREAREANHILGQLTVGDRLAVLMNEDSTKAKWVVNVSTIMGDWVQISPLDGASEIGFRIKEGGIAESIEQSDIVYRTWRVFRNKLELVWLREGGGSAEEGQQYTLMYLSTDSMSLRDAEDAYEYTRPHEVENMGVEASDFGDYEF